jgi:spermidine synthase
VVEISPAIADAARHHFSDINGGVLDDPRVRLTLADGRNALLVSKERFDLIGMELSSIWFAGASSLYSLEYYELVRDHLAPNGVFQQWVQLHHMYPRDFATIIGTLHQVFPHVALFYGGGQGILLAKLEPFDVDAERLRQLESRKAIRTRLGDHALADLLDDLLLFGPDVDDFIASVASEEGRVVAALVSTDENVYLEYATPRGNVLPWHARERLVEQLRGHRSRADYRSWFSAF